MYYLSKRYKKYSGGGDILGALGGVSKEAGLSMVPGGQAVGQITNGLASVVDSIAQPKDEFSKPSMFASMISGQLRGGTLGGIGALLNHKGQVREVNNRIAEKRMAMPERMRSMAVLANNPELTTGNTGAEYFAAGGNLSKQYMKATGGSLKPLSSESVEVKGPSHEQGGVQLPEQNAEVEGEETIHNDFVFSDRLGFADAHRTIAKAIGKIEKKGVMTPERINALERLEQRQESLKLSQEFFKQTMLT